MRKEERARREAERKAKRRARRKQEEAAMMEPDICTGCGLPMRPGQTFKHNWCY
jgi:hypothetical protein